MKRNKTRVELIQAATDRNAATGRFVDAAHCLRDLRIGKDLQSVGQATDEHAPRTGVDLLTEQAEFANVIILNKTDLVTGEELGAIEAFTEQFPPHFKNSFVVGEGPISTNHGYGTVQF